MDSRHQIATEPNMSDKKSHEEIIKRVCKEILLSNGLFKKGRQEFIWMTTDTFLLILNSNRHPGAEVHILISDFAFYGKIAIILLLTILRLLPPELRISSSIKMTLNLKKPCENMLNSPLNKLWTSENYEISSTQNAISERCVVK